MSLWQQEKPGRIYKQAIEYLVSHVDRFLDGMVRRDYAYVDLLFAREPDQLDVARYAVTRIRQHRSFCRRNALAGFLSLQFCQPISQLQGQSHRR